MTLPTLDALFLHRPWRLPPDALRPEVGVLSSHLPFDEHLTTGDNALFAVALGLRTREVLGTKAGRPLGMVGDVDPLPAADALARVAVVGAMTDELVREAVARGVELYVTGQLRAPARAAVRETGLAVAAVGHARAERWGLGALAGMLQRRWPALTVEVGGPGVRL